MIPDPDDTIVAVSSAGGPGRRAVVRLSGPGARRAVEAVAGPIPDPPRRSWVPVQLRLSDVASPLPADLYLFRAPHSYTGQDVAEVHTLSSPPLVERLVADLLRAGARPAGPGEFTLRAFLAGKKTLPRAEAVQSVIEAGTDADLTRALEHLAGGVTAPLTVLRGDLLDLLADVEAGLDFAAEDIEFVTKPETVARIGAALAQLANVRRQLDARAVSGRPVRVALAGAPNAGKSSLFNALAGGPAALVSDVAGTTRDYLARTITLDGIEVELTDTAGWQDAGDDIEAQAQQLGLERMERADVILWCVPAGERLNPADAARLRATGAEVLPVRTKADLSAASDGLPTSVMQPKGIEAVRIALTTAVADLARPSLAPSLSRCRGHIDAAMADLQTAHRHALFDDPPELLALALRAALDEIGATTGAVYTNDLLDRIFSRFCIGK